VLLTGGLNRGKVTHQTGGGYVTIEIRNRFTNAIIIAGEYTDVRAAVLAAKEKGADLSSANLYGADLSSANLSSAENIPALANAQASILPEEGQLIGWKKCKNGVLVKVMVGKNAKRSNATGRKCRAEYVKVLEVIGAEVGISSHDGLTAYRAGKIVRCGTWNANRWVECGGGIHFFLTRIEAENY
jgi:Family of unknown function (DUF5758)/Pentapeptide repeats (8 copies)